MIAGSESTGVELPRIGDREAAERGLARWSRLPDALSGIAPELAPVDPGRLLEVVFGNSSYL
ncbi:MAG TPA: hypothetical protein VFY19_00970, partial [Geminicoccaceae bacterium]|nr:hypothetical protein [Geminicoccaceae bacterium]